MHVHPIKHLIFSAWWPIAKRLDMATGHGDAAYDEVAFRHQCITLDTEHLESCVKIRNSGLETLAIVLSPWIGRMVDKILGEKIIELLQVGPHEGLIKGDDDGFVLILFQHHSDEPLKDHGVMTKGKQ